MTSGTIVPMASYTGGSLRDVVSSRAISKEREIVGSFSMGEIQTGACRPTLHLSTSWFTNDLGPFVYLNTIIELPRDMTLPIDV